MEKFYEVIQCDNCDTIQVAMVKHYEDHEWPLYVHECENCGHIILESEWNNIEGPAAKKAIKDYITALRQQIAELTETIEQLEALSSIAEPSGQTRQEP